MKKYIYLLMAALSITTLISCGSDGDLTDGEGNDGDTMVPAPTAANLIFPEDNTECNEGELVNETQSRVTFRWGESENTDVYTVTLTNMRSNGTRTVNATTNEAPITIDRGTPYQWSVTSTAEGTNETATSAVARFYNQGPGVANYAPFPPTAVNPAMGATVDIDMDGNVNLQWESSDIDGDLAGYEVFIGTQNPPAGSLGQLMESNRDANLQAGTTYFWSVNAMDHHGNIASSQVFQFRTR